MRDKLKTIIDHILKDDVMVDIDNVYDVWLKQNPTIENVVQSLMLVRHPEFYKVQKKFYDNVAKGKYNCLKDDESKQIRKFHEKCLLSIADLIEYPNDLIKSHNRIVIGDHGCYIECYHRDFNVKLKIKPGEEYRVHNNKAKYNWMVPEKDGLVNNEFKIYRQKRNVKYADYIPGRFYISIFDMYEFMFRHHIEEKDLSLDGCVRKLRQETGMGVGIVRKCILNSDYDLDKAREELKRY